MLRSVMKRRPSSEDHSHFLISEININVRGKVLAAGMQFSNSGLFDSVLSPLCSCLSGLKHSFNYSQMNSLGFD